MTAIRARAKIPERVVAGEIFSVRTLVSHRMESGERKDADGDRIPRDIIHAFRAELDGETVFSAELAPAIAANPFIEFALRVERTGTLRLIWTDDAGETTTLERSIALAP